MFTLISRIYPSSLNKINNGMKTIIKHQKCLFFRQFSQRYNFSSKNKKVIEMKASTIQIVDKIQSQQKEQLIQTPNYLQIKKKIHNSGWQELAFDQLCNLDPEIINALQTDVKKDKFNISDEQFLKNTRISTDQSILNSYDKLDRYYKKIYSLLKNTNDYFEEFPERSNLNKGYLNEIYITDLKKDKQLIQTIARFIKHISKPERLQALAEPTFVKYLLSLKRQLMLLGIKFQTKAQKRQALQISKQAFEGFKQQKQQLPKIKILQILNYEYEFWQDVKHNRAKNGNEDNFLIQTKQIPNPNDSVLLKQQYPTIIMKYISKYKKSKDCEMNFCLKANLLIEIDGQFQRNIKVEWKGPSNRNTVELSLKKKSLEQNEQEEVPKVEYKVIDYENIYKGNPTIRPIFYF